MSAPIPVNQVLYKSTNYQSVDAVIVDERPPPSRIQEIGQNVVCCIGRFERGPLDTITTISSTQELLRTFGGVGPDATGAPYEGYLAVHPSTKRFDQLRIIRASNSTMALATKSFNDDTEPTAVLRVDALNKGAWGNRIAVSVQAASDGEATHFNLVVSFDGTVRETHKNIDLADWEDDEEIVLLGGSDYIRVFRLAIGDGRPKDIAATDLESGSDGTFTDADFTGGPSDPRGMQLLYGSEAQDVSIFFFAERSSATLKAAGLALASQERKNFVTCPDAFDDTKAAAIADVALSRSDRVWYAYPYVYASIPELGGLTVVNPASFLAATVAALPPHIDPAGVNGEPYLYGVRGLVDRTLATADYENFNAAGICALNFAGGRVGRWRWRSGVTSDLDAARTMIFRRRMADFLHDSIGEGLTAFQNRPLTRENKVSAKGVIESFLRGQQLIGVLPRQEDIARTEDGMPLVPFLVDIDSLNTAETEALGQFVIALFVRIFPSMRFIVLRTQIGTTVEIREDAV